MHDRIDTVNRARRASTLDIVVTGTTMLLLCGSLMIMASTLVADVPLYPVSERTAPLN